MVISGATGHTFDHIIEALHQVQVLVVVDQPVQQVIMVRLVSEPAALKLFMSGDIIVKTERM